MSSTGNINLFCFGKPNALILGHLSATLTIEVISVRRDLKKQATRDLLVRAALELFGTHGYEQTTVQQITQAAGVAKGTFFNYFASKEDVLREVFASQEAWAVEELEALAEEMDGPLAPQLTAFMVNLSTNLPVTRPLIRALFQAVLNEPTEVEDPYRAGAGMIEGLIPIFAAGQDSGEFTRAIPARRLAELAMQTYFGVLLAWSTTATPQPLAEMMAESFRLFFEGVNKR
jgi:AcrR family transcriptional regulator